MKCTICGIEIKNNVFSICAKCFKKEAVKQHDLIEPQPNPEKSNGDLWLGVIEDMKQRRNFGIQKYGVPLQCNNGRDALIDAYQEALDLVVYLKQSIIERDEALCQSNQIKKKN